MDRKQAYSYGGQRAVRVERMRKKRKRTKLMDILVDNSVGTARGGKIKII